MTDETVVSTEAITIPANHVGPPTMAHGGFVAGLLASRLGGTAQVTLKAPTPVETELAIVTTDSGVTLRNGEAILVEAVPTTLEIDVPAPPSVAEARAAEAGSPSLWNGHGVHPTCLGCGKSRDDGDGLEIGVGPLVVDGVDQVAAVWEPGERHLLADGTVDPLWVLAALDCPGAMAFISREVGAGLLGRIVFEQYETVEPGELVVSGWQMERDGRKMFAGTALSDGAGTVLAAARATWFGRG